MSLFLVPLPSPTHRSRCLQTGAGDGCPAGLAPGDSLGRLICWQRDGEGREAGPSKAVLSRRQAGRSGGSRWAGPHGDRSWAFSAAWWPHGGPCWLRLSSRALHTHMDTTVAFPSLNCMMNGWPINSSGAGLSFGCFRMH